MSAYILLVYIYIYIRQREWDEQCRSKGEILRRFSNQGSTFHLNPRQEKKLQPLTRRSTVPAAISGGGTALAAPVARHRRAPAHGPRPSLRACAAESFWVLRWRRPVVPEVGVRGLRPARCRWWFWELPRRPKRTGSLVNLLLLCLQRSWASFCTLFLAGRVAACGAVWGSPPACLASLPLVLTPVLQAPGCSCIFLCNLSVSASEMAAAFLNK